MRTISLLAQAILFIFFATTAGGATIVISQTQTGPPETIPAPPQPIILQAGEEGSAPSERVSLTMPSLSADDRDRILNYSPDDGLSRSWVITAANAADYCFDWDGFEAALTGSGSRIDLVLGPAATSGSFGSPVIPGASYLREFQMERIEIDLDYWLWHPILKPLQAYRLEGRVIGEAVIVPEPPAWLPILSGACAAGLMGYRMQRVVPGGP